MLDEYDLRVRILANYLDLEPEDDDEDYEYLFDEGLSNYGYETFRNGNEEYLVLTDEEADNEAREYIESSLWAFSAEFLANFTGLPSVVFVKLSELYEDCNDTIKEIIGRDMQYFVEDAISTDGRGHFISSYDGDEAEWTAPDEWEFDTDEYWYIYRVG